MFEVGQKVRAKENGLGITVGDVGTVTELHNNTYPVRVKFPSSKNDYRLGSLFLADEIEAIPDKQEDSVQEIKVGDTVEVIDLAGGHTKQLGETFKVKAVEHDLYSSKELIVLEDPTRVRCAAYAERFKVVQPKPTKAKSQKITVDQAQVGDLIVSFYEDSGVEYRNKGIADHRDWEGDWKTVEGGLLTYFEAVDARAQHVYLLNRPEPKKPEIEDGVYWVTEEGHHASPWKVTVTNETAKWETKDGKTVMTVGYPALVRVKNGDALVRKTLKFHTEDPTPKGFDALDKTKTYLLKDKRTTDYPLDWYLAFKDGMWKYGPKDDISTTADGFEDYFTEGTNAWDKPVEWVEPELTVEDLVGKKYRRDEELDYKVTAKGNLKVRWSDRTVHEDGWDISGYDLEDVLGWIKSGEAVEI